MRGEIIFGRLDPATVRIDERELRARLGEDANSPALSSAVESETLGIISAAVPAYAARRVSLKFLGGGKMLVDSKLVESVGLERCLCGSEEAIILAVTLGAAVDRYIAKRRVLSESVGFVADSVGSALAEAVCDSAEREICRGLSITKRFSPGYSDLSLSSQGWILDALSASRLLGIALTDSTLMVPMKSITAIIGVKNG